MSTQVDNWLARIDARARHGARKYRATGSRRVVAESMRNDEGDLLSGLYHYDLVEADGTFAGAYAVQNLGGYWKLQRMTPVEDFWREPEPYHDYRKDSLVGLLYDWANGGMQP